jgi:Tol biopolymer transport system component
MNRILIILISSLFFVFNFINAQASKKIVYSSDNTKSNYLQIFTMNEDGSGKKQITDLPANCSKPRWSPDGTKIVFQTDDDRIFMIVNADTDTPEEPLFIFGGSNPSFAGDGEQIIFNSDHDGALSIYIIDPAEGEAYLISTIGYSNQQTLSKDGKYLVYSAFYDGNKCIMMTDLEDTTDESTFQININDNANLVPDISSDANMIVYAGFNNQLNGTIYIFNNGKENALSKGITSCNLPKFSSDDKKIAFLSIGTNSVKLYTMGIDGNNKEPVNNKGGNIGTYKWLDNERIIFDAENGSDYQIGIVDVNTGKCTMLTEKGNNLQPDIH